ncbi:LPXTG cell wall anchor domain-containing protein [Kitasatospora sp. NPDC004723]|uniref:DUF7927 domain-containing protein n=1 Tax=Kitasatospora sp. NPDC004723 TaxID=3154288 RepID=UPI0033B2D6E3
MSPVRRLRPRPPYVLSALLAVVLGAGAAALTDPAPVAQAEAASADHVRPAAQPAARAAEPRPRGAGTQRPIGPDPVVDLLAHGNLTMASNSVLTCDDSDGTVCSDTEGSNNGRTKFVKVDPNAPGPNASSAQLLLPAGANVLSARLYWQFNPTNTSTMGGTSGDINTGNQVFWKVPGGASYEQLTADTYDWFDQMVGGTPPEPLLAGGAVKDVTAEVKAAGPGSYTVADIQACAGRSSAQNFGGNNVGCWGGWSLVVAYEDQAEPLRYLQVWDGYQLLRDPNNATTITLGGIRTPATTAPKAIMGITVGDGDAPIAGDTLAVGSATDNLTLLPMPGPTGIGTDNAFTSRIDHVATDGTGTNITTRDPDPVNNYGYDARMIDVTGKIPAGSHQALVRISGAGDALEPQALWLALDALEPDLQVSKANTPPGSPDDNPPGLVGPGQTITYSFTVANRHQDGSSSDLDTATGVTVTDRIPVGTTFVAGSNPACQASGQTVTCTVADLAPGAEATVAFQVTVDDSTAVGTHLDDTATLHFRGSQTQREQERTSNTVRNTVAEVPGYTIVKTATPATARPGDTVRYRLQVTNTSQADAPGVTLTDDLSGLLNSAAYNNDAVADRGSVNFAGTTLTWTGDLPAGANATIDYSVTVHSPLAADAVLRNAVTSGTFPNNCPPGSTDPRCRAEVPVTVPSPSPSPTHSHSPTHSPRPTHSPSHSHSPTHSPSPSPTHSHGPSPSPSPTHSHSSSPSPSPSPSHSHSSNPNPSHSPEPGPTGPPHHGGHLPETGSDTARLLPLVGLAALGAVAAGALLVIRARRTR